MKLAISIKTIKSKSTKQWLLVLLVLIAIRPFVQGYLSRQFVLYSDAPAHAILQQRRERCHNSVAEIERLWDTRRIPHRQFAMDFARDVCNKRKDGYQMLQRLLTEAVYDADLSVRRIAVSLLTETQNAQNLYTLLPLLNDKDPEIQIMALRALRLQADPAFNAAVFPLLDDPEQSVAIAAAAALRRSTKHDFGVRTISSDTAVKSGLNNWRSWAASNKHNFAVPDNSQNVVPDQLPAPDVAFETLDGGKVLLSDAHGTPVLLLFWATWDETSREILSKLMDLQVVRQQRILFYPVSVNAVAAEHIGGPDVHSHVCDEGHQHGPDPELLQNDPDAIKKLVQTVAHSIKLNVPILLDDGQAAVTYICNELPTFVFIDKNQIVRRRFSGVRSTAVLQEMINELVRGKTEQIVKKNQL